MQLIRNWINLVENTDSEREFYINQANEFRAERKLWRSVSDELMASYRDGSHTKERLDGSLEWYKNGKLHRDGDLPAAIDADGTLHWYKNGEPHRDDNKPAVIRADGTLEWYKNGDWHRDGDKPVWIWENGTLIWSKNGLNHRVLGPAVIDGNNNFKWWFKGGQIPVNSQEEYEEWIHKNHPFDNEIKQLYY